MTDSRNAVTQTAARHVRRALRPAQVYVTQTVRRLTRRLIGKLHRLAFDVQIRLAIAQPQRVYVRSQKRP
jgi:hypothetical protein